MRANSLSLTGEVSQLFISTSRGVFPLSYVRGTLCFLSEVEWILRGPDSKEFQNSLLWLTFRLVFHLTNKGMSESPVETLEKAVVLGLIWTGGLTSL